MSGIAVAGLSSSRKTPGIFLAVLLGTSPTSAGQVPKKILLIGNKITSAISGSSPTLAVAAGTQANAAPVALASADQAATFFGRGSELHRMAKATFAQYPDALLYGCASVESGGSAAIATMTFATNASLAYTVRLTMCGLAIDVPVASGDTPTVIATACCNAVNTQADLPLTAQFSAGVITFTAKHPGTRGNELRVRAQFIDAAGNPTEITTSSTTSPGSTTGIWSDVTTVGSAYKMSGGTTDATITAALAAIVSTRYDRIALAFRDATALDAVAAQVDSQASVTSQIRQQFIYGTAGTSASATTLATGRNDARGQCVWHYNSPTPAEEFAAQVAAARLIGDALVGGIHVGEASRPSANLDGVELATCVASPFAADAPTGTEIEAALNNGITPLSLSTARPGFCAVVRSITSRSLDGSGVQNYSVIDTSSVTVCDYVADDLQGDLSVVYAGKNLAADNSDGSPPTAENVVTPSMVRARIAYKLGLYEENGITRDAAANMPLLAVEEDTGTPGRLNCEIPVEPATPLHIVGGNVRQIS